MVFDNEELPEPCRALPCMAQLLLSKQGEKTTTVKVHLEGFDLHGTAWSLGHFGHSDPRFEELVRAAFDAMVEQLHSILDLMGQVTAAYDPLPVHVMREGSDLR